MNVIVCVKQIPDPASPGALDPSTNTLKREGKLILDDSDSYGVEMALQLVSTAGGGEVSLVSMAPNGETAGLRTALAMGAAKAVLVSDPELCGSGALSHANAPRHAPTRPRTPPPRLTRAAAAKGARGRRGPPRRRRLDHRRHRVERRVP